MKLNPQCEKVLKAFYDLKQAGRNPVEFKLEDTDLGFNALSARRHEIITLKDEGFLQQHQTTLNNHSFSLTEKGIKYVEENL